MPKVAKPFTHTHEKTGQPEYFPVGSVVSDEMANHWHVAAHLEGAQPNYAAPGNQSYAQMETDKRRIADLLERAGDQDGLAERAAFLAGVHRASSTAISATTAARGLEQAPYDGSPNFGSLKQSATMPGLGRGDVAPPPPPKRDRPPAQPAPVRLVESPPAQKPVEPVPDQAAAKPQASPAQASQAAPKPAGG